MWMMINCPIHFRDNVEALLGKDCGGDIYTSVTVSDVGRYGSVYTRDHNLEQIEVSIDGQRTDLSWIIHCSELTVTVDESTIDQSVHFLELLSGLN